MAKQHSSSVDYLPIWCGVNVGSEVGVGSGDDVVSVVGVGSGVGVGMMCGQRLVWGQGFYHGWPCISHSKQWTNVHGVGQRTNTMI